MPRRVTMPVSWFVDELARANGVVLRAENKFSGELGRMRTSPGRRVLAAQTDDPI